MNMILIIVAKGDSRDFFLKESVLIIQPDFQVFDFILLIHIYHIACVVERTLRSQSYKALHIKSAIDFIHGNKWLLLDAHPASLPLCAMLEKASPIGVKLSTHSDLIQLKAFPFWIFYQG